MINIIEMTHDHVDQIAALEIACFSDPWSAKSIAYELENELSLWLVALDENRVVGYVGSQSVIDAADMMNLAVVPDFRRCGVAKQLIDQLIEKLKCNGVRFLMLEVRVSNTPAISLYEKLGFSLVGRRPGYYRNPREDALILRKEWEI